MPNAKVLNEKAAVVAALEERIKNAQAGVLVDYRGITVAEDTELRNELRKNGVEYGVVKNTMVRRALDDLNLDELDKVLNGNTSLATATDDPIVPIRLLSEAAKKLGEEKFHIKAAFVEGKVLSQGEIAQFATLSSKKDLYAQLVGTLMAPVANLAAVVDAIANKGGEAAAE
ncbi:MAG: 50S ribosomal protein L10 [Oscillospiraceae bacterium]|nr:50S ribosomal protein L10 [Oscillospiraceae bacterium]MBR1845089.1 50S ribosomal protein L10 [Oscillospiraceae bacterium]